MDFEISSSAVDGIKFLNDVINEETSRKLIVNAVKQILITGPGKNAFLLLFSNIIWPLIIFLVAKIQILL